MLIEVNLLWKRAYLAPSGAGKARAYIPFLCQFCNSDMVDKANLGWHSQRDHCLAYSAEVSIPLKIFPTRGHIETKRVGMSLRSITCLSRGKCLRSTCSQSPSQLGALPRCSSILIRTKTRRRRRRTVDIAAKRSLVMMFGAKAGTVQKLVQLLQPLLHGSLDTVLRRR